MSSTLTHPVLLVRTSLDYRVRVIDFLLKNVDHLHLLHEEVYDKNTECLLFFSPTEDGLAEKQTELEHKALSTVLAASQPKKWTCNVCTYINERNVRGLMCAMCDSPRSVVDWAGFSKPGQNAHKKRVNMLVAGFGICVKAAQKLAASPGACRAFEMGMVTIVTHVVDSWSELMKNVNDEVHVTDARNIEKRVRIRCKRSMQEKIMKEHTRDCVGNDNCLLAPHDFTHVICAQEVSSKTAEMFLGQPPSDLKIQNTSYLYGVVSRKNDFASIAPNNKPTPGPKMVCRAYYKIEEAAEASQMMRDCFSTAENDCAVDLGASPGGWTAFLAKKFKRVIAVDTGDLHESVASEPNVTHLRTLLQRAPLENEEDQTVLKFKDSLEKIKNACPSVPSFVCCDINQEPVDAVEIVLRTIPFIAPGTIFMITMKLTTRGKQGQSLQVQQAKKELELYCDDVEEHWLFNNTNRERTLFGRYRGKSTPATTTPTLTSTSNVDDVAVDVAVTQSTPPATPPATTDTTMTNDGGDDVSDEVRHVVANRQKGLDVVVDCSTLILTDSNHAQFDRILTECHNFGVSKVHIINEAESEFVTQHATKVGNALIIELNVHSSHNECLEALGDDVTNFAITSNAAASSLYKTNFVSSTAIAMWLQLDCDEQKPVSLPDVYSAFTQFSLPHRGLAAQLAVCSVVAAALSEVSRQRI